MARPTPTMGRHIGAADGGGQPYGPRVLCWRAHSPMSTPQPLPRRSEAKPHWWSSLEVRRGLCGVVDSAEEVVEIGAAVGPVEWRGGRVVAVLEREDAF